MSILRGFVKGLPTLLLSFFLAVAVWISAINASDPIKQAAYSRPVAIDRVGLDPSLVIVSTLPTQESITLSAPNSSWERIFNDKTPVRAWIDLSGLGVGAHNVPVNIQVITQPAKLISYLPRTINVTLEKLVTQEFPIHLIRRGDPAIGFQADAPNLSADKVTISGPASLVSKVKDARVTLDLTQASDNINRKLDIEVVDGSDAHVDNVSITPAQIIVTQPISQLGGYRNVVIKVASTGQVAGGYRLTSMSVYPPTVTVFSSNPQLVDQLPGYVETSPLDLTGVKEDVDKRLPLNLPNGVEVVGDQTVLVQ
ncbi:MAG TPA: CdaR family protein, partial [Anaerolineaceae bacterium]